MSNEAIKLEVLRRSVEASKVHRKDLTAGI